MTVEIERDNKARCESISNKTFPILKGLSVLELGPQDGSWFTRHLLKYSDNVTVIEYNSLVADQLKDDYPKVKVIIDDFHNSLTTIGHYDAVVLYGVLYHSHIPLKVLEDIANFIKPKYILLENILGKNSGKTVTIDYEESNVSGMRFSDNKTCKIVLSLGQDLYETAMINLDYVKIDEFDVAEDSKLMSGPGDLKKFAYYSIWQQKETL